MSRFIKFIKGKLLNNFKEKEKVDIYNVAITNTIDSITQKDLELIRFFLKFTPSRNNLFCIINKWSDDIFANISCESNKQNFERCTQNMLTINEILNSSNEEDIEDFFWLLGIEKIDDKRNVVNDVIDFINSRKKEYQHACSKNSSIYFSKYSDVNSYTVVWGQENYLNFILQDVG